MSAAIKFLAAVVLAGLATVHADSTGCPVDSSVPATTGCLWTGSCTDCANLCVMNPAPLDLLANSSVTYKGLEDGLMCALMPVALKAALFQFQDMVKQMKDASGRRLASLSVASSVQQASQDAQNVKSHVVKTLRSILPAAAGLARNPAGHGRSLIDPAVAGMLGLKANYTAAQIAQFSRCVTEGDLRELKYVAYELGGGEHFAELQAQYNESMAMCATQGLTSEQGITLKSFFGAAASLASAADFGAGSGDGMDMKMLVDALFRDAPRGGDACMPKVWDWDKTQAATKAMGNLAVDCMAGPTQPTCKDGAFSVPSGACAIDILQFMGVPSDQSKKVLDAFMSVAQTCSSVSSEASCPTAASPAQVSSLSAAVSSAQAQANGTAGPGPKESGARVAAASLVLLGAAAAAALAL